MKTVFMKYTLLCGLLLPEPEYPSCLQATFASFAVHPSLHTVPHNPFTHTSTLPSKEDVPPISLVVPCGLQAAKE